MAKLQPDLRAHLHNIGAWGTYQKRVEQLKSLGIYGKDQKDILAQEFGMEGQPNAPFVAVNGVAPIAPVQQYAPPPAPATLANHPIPPPDKAHVDPSIWAGKPEPEPRRLVEWIFNNICNKKVRPIDAPSMGAWGMLVECQNSRDLRHDFLTSIWPKLLPSKLAPEDTHLGEKSVAHVIDILDKVAEARAKAMAVAEKPKESV